MLNHWVKSSSLIARAKCQPWPMSQPASRSIRSTGAVSIPSATTVNPSYRAIDNVARMIFQASGSVSQWVTKDRSIFSSEKGSRSRVSNDE